MSDHMRVVDSSFTSDGETVKCAYCNEPWPCPIERLRERGQATTPEAALDYALDEACASVQDCLHDGTNVLDALRDNGWDAVPKMPSIPDIRPESGDMSRIVDSQNRVENATVFPAKEAERE